MRKMLFASAFSAAVACALWPAAAGAQTQATTALEICVGEGAGEIVVIGTGSHQVIGPLNLAFNTNSCQTIPVGAGEYTLRAGKYLTGPCYKTVNGDLVNPPTLATPKVKCQGKVHHIHVQNNFGPTSTIETDEVTVPVISGSTMHVSFHITDVRYFECVDDTGTNPTRVCEPEGSTTT